MRLGLIFSLDGKNAPNDVPPFDNGNISGMLGGAAGFNGFVSNPIGRGVAIGLRADFRSTSWVMTAWSGTNRSGEGGC